MTQAAMAQGFPDPNTAALVTRRQQAVPRGVWNAAPLFAAEARGAILRDVAGRRPIDFAGGIGTLNVGHAHPRGRCGHRGAGAARFTHTCFHVAIYEPYVALTERLNARVPGPLATKTFLVNSGAEAVENAVKIACAATGRPAVIAFEHAFHGRTLLGMSLTGKVSPYNGGVRAIRAGDLSPPVPVLLPLSGKQGTRVLSGGTRLLGPAPGSPRVTRVGGRGDHRAGRRRGRPHPGSPEVLRSLAAWCRDHGALLIADEILTGFGRTGQMFVDRGNGGQGEN